MIFMGKSTDGQLGNSLFSKKRDWAYVCHLFSLPFLTVYFISYHHKITSTETKSQYNEDGRTKEQEGFEFVIIILLSLWNYQCPNILLLCETECLYDRLNKIKCQKHSKLS